MPPIRRNKQSTFPVGVSSLYCNNDDLSTAGLQLSLSLAPTIPETDGSPGSSPSPLAKKKRSHGKARPPGHIPRPPNAFIIFRTEYIRSMATQNSTPEVSKNLGEKWRNMSSSDKRPWVKKAEEAKILHQEQNPGYKYKPVHPRDEFGNCIRKPRRPNRPRVKKMPPNGDILDHLPGSFQWLEGKPDVEFPNTALPSDISSVSSPPPSPSPAPSLAMPSSSTYLSHRRSSSVPLAGPDDSFFFGTASSFAYPSSSTGIPTGQLSRRLNKRPSTSIDFMYAGLGHSEMYGFANGTETYLSPNDPSSWRLGHRRSISAPGFGSEVPTNFTFPSHSAPQEVNSLTPINPVFGNVFDKFSWNTTSDTNPHNAHTEFAAMQPFAALNHKQQAYITVQISPTATSPSSDLSSVTSPPDTTPSSQLPPTPAILHPAPVATFDFSAFQAQISEFEFDAAAAQGAFEDPLGLVAQTCLSEAGVMYNAEEPFYTLAGDDRTTATVQSTAATVMQSVSDPATLQPLPAVNHASDIQGYQEGMRYTQRCPEISPPHVLDFNELIVDGY